MTAALTRLDEGLSATWAPKKRPGPLEWAERHIVIDKRFSPRPGRFSCDYTPYLRKLHEWYGDRTVRQITLAKGAQLGGTTLMANLIQYTVAEVPGPMLYVTSTAENAKSWSERELIPRIRSCETMQAYLPSDPDQFKKTEMQFTTCTLKLTGSNSESNLASRGIRYLFADEVDKWPDSSETEAPALELAMARTIQFRNVSKTVLTSTPTVETGAVWTQFMAGSQHRLHVECPDCGALQWLRFEQVRWSPELEGPEGWDFDGVKESAVYQCEECGSPWEQSCKRTLITEACEADRWIAGNPSAPHEHRSAHISSMYSPTLSWGDMAVLFLQKKNTPGGLHDFRNTYEGLPWVAQLVSVKESNVHALRCRDYRLGTIPAFLMEKFAYLVLTADPGGDRTHWAVTAMAEDGEMAVIDCGTVLAPEDLLLLLREKSYPGRDGAPWPIGWGIVDSGYQASRIYDLCARSGGLLVPSKGSPAAYGTYSASPIKTHRTLQLQTYVDYTLKTALYYEKIEKRLAPLLHLPDDAPAELIRGLSGQTMVENRTARGATKYWKDVRDDHYGDCVKLAVLSYWIAKTLPPARRRR